MQNHFQPSSIRLH